MTKWIKKHQTEAFFLIALLILASFLRFWRLPEYMTFLGDEGRDALIVKKILVDHDFPLIGPPTSVGNMYLGPLYYYMMAVPMAIFWMNPAAAAGLNALIGVGTVFLIYYLGRRWFGSIAAAAAATLYAISPVTIIYSRSSWNPNPAPFFALLALLGFDRARQKRDFRWLVLSGAALAFAVQMHYLALILLPVFTLYWLNELVEKLRGMEGDYFWRGSILAIAAFLLLMSPLVIFDFRHRFINYRAMSAFFSSTQTSSDLGISSAQRVWALYQNDLVSRYMAGGNKMLTPVLAILILLPLSLIIGSKIKRDKKWPYKALGAWMVVGMVGLSAYRQAIYDHYLGFVNPAPYLLLAATLSCLKKYWQLGAALVLLLIVGFVNLQKSPLFTAPNNQLHRTQQVSQFIIRESENQPFNFALLSQNNYDAAYQFYLWLYGHKPLQVHETVTDQLFVVCEDPVCHPVGNPKDEIAAFGMTKIDKTFEIFGVKVYKLIHNPTGTPG